MATPVIMPRQGQSVESCIIGKWYKKVGDKVAVGEDLFSYETDKAAFDEAAKVDGEVLAIFFAEDDDVPCLIPVHHLQDVRACVVRLAIAEQLEPLGEGRFIDLSRVRGRLGELEAGHSARRPD